MSEAVLLPYITADDLRDALSPPTFLAIFDDDTSGQVADDRPAVVQVIRRAHSRVVSRLPDLYKTIPNVDPQVGPVPDLLFDAELAYAVALSLQRHPEYARTFGEDTRVKQAFSQAEQIMTELQEAILRIADMPPEPAPRNVGGIILNSGPRVMIDNPDGTPNSGDF